MANETIPNIPVLATTINDSDLFEKADGTLAGQSQRVPASLFKTYLGLPITSYFNLVGSAYIGGDQTGNTRGNNALDVQSFRGQPSQVASGAFSSVFGNNSTASGYYSTASGYYSTASGNNSTSSGNRSTAIGYGSTAIGYGSTASGNRSTASGNYSTASGNRSTASGNYSTASGNYSTASGAYVNNSTDYSAEVGYDTNKINVSAASFSYFIGGTLSGQILPDTAGNGGTTLMLLASDDATPMFVHITSLGVITATTSA